MNTGVYLIRNRVSGKVYVGSSATSLAKRWRGHLRELRRGSHYNPKLQASWNKHGESAFEFIVVEHCEPSLCEPHELCWINRLNAVEEGYNICASANTPYGRKWSQEMRRKLSEAHKGYKPTEEALVNMRAASARRRGVPLPEESRKKMSEAAKRRYCDPAEREKTSRSSKVRNTAAVLRRPDVVKKRVMKLGSPELRAKLSAAHKNKPLTEEHRRKMVEGLRKPAVRDKIAAALRGRKLPPEHVEKSAAFHRGRKRAEETKAKISQAISKWWAKRKGVQNV